MKFIEENAIIIGKTLVISDLHIGFELELSNFGITIPSQDKEFLDKIFYLKNKYDIEKLIILGDIKHDFSSSSSKEFIKVRNFLEKLSSEINTIIIKGNHDGNIELIAPEGIEIKNELKYRKYGMIHGHSWPSEKLLDCETLIMGHVHPAIEFKYETGRSIEQVWMIAKANRKSIEKKYGKKSKIKKFIIMPSFNKLLSGVSVNSEKFKTIGPILRNELVKLDESEIYLTDGTYLGTLKRIKKL